MTTAKEDEAAELAAGWRAVGWTNGREIGYKQGHDDAEAPLIARLEAMTADIKSALVGHRSMHGHVEECECVEIVPLNVALVTISADTGHAGCASCRALHRHHTEREREGRG